MKRTTADGTTREHLLPDTMVPVDLRCEYLVNPLGLDVREPRLSWAVRSSDKPGQRQTAYRIIVALSEESLIETSTALWDSGRVTSNQTVHVPYAGKSLTSGQRYYWHVQIWDRDGQPHAPSGTAWWETGLFDDSDWRARWISGTEPSVLFRKTFQARKPVRKARLYICGQGVYEAFLNGETVGDQVLGPQLSHFPSRMLYDTFDVTGLIQEGPNALGVSVAPGWFGDIHPRKNFQLPKGLRHALIAQISVEYSDGAVETIGSDETWKTTPSYLEPVTSHWTYGLGFSGETLDATREPRGWTLSDFNDAAWEKARIIPSPTRMLSARMLEPNRIVETIVPTASQRCEGPLERETFVQTVTDAAQRNWGTTASHSVLSRHWNQAFQQSFAKHDGTCLEGWEFDFGKHVSGWVRLKATGSRGDGISVFGLDNHLLRGDRGEEVRLHFAHRAFRYVPVHLFSKGSRPKIENVEALAIQNDIREVGRFQSAHPTLNRIHEVAARTWETHLLSGMPMDSWQERFGTALIQNCEASIYWFDTGAFYTKWLTDHRDQQRSDGYFPMSGAPIAFDYWCPNSTKNAIVIVPWLMYLHYGDWQIVEKNYPALRRWLEMCIPKNDTGRTWQPPADHGESEAGFGDHGRPTSRWYDAHTGDLFETLHTIDCFRIAEQFASLLGKTEDRDRYRAVQERLTAKVNRDEFLDKSKGLYGGGDQGCHAMAIYLNVVPSSLREKVAQHLIQDIMEQRGGHMNTGFLGNWYLMKALIALNRPDVAFTLITNESSPSWASMLKHPETPEELTLLPEFFTGGMIPHPGLCSLGFWFYQGLGGIQPDTEHPGFQRFIIKPQIVPEIGWVKTEYNSIRGPINSNWEVTDNRITLDVNVPTNTCALVYVPAQDPTAVTTPDGSISHFLRMQDGYAVFEVIAGSHQFQVRRSHSDRLRIS